MARANATSRLYAFISGAWTQLVDAGNAYSVETSWGTSNNSPLVFVAETGEAKFTLKNNTGQYTPGGPSALSGFKRGIPVKLVVTYDSEDYIRWRGYISDIEIGSATRDKMVTVTCLDWMNYAVRHPVVNPGILLNVTSDEVLENVISNIEIPPQQTQFSEGAYAFDTALDVVDSKTTAYSEFNKVAFSELTHIYLKKDKYNGETLVAENLNTRHGWVTPGEIPLAAADSGFALNENGDFELNENGDFVLLNQTTDVTFNSDVFTDFDAPYGDMVINRIVNSAYPRRLDSSPQILFQLDEPVEIGVRPLDSVERNSNFILEGTYANPDGGLPVGGRDIITPVITTDYLMNTAEDGSGSDISSDLTVRFEAGTDGFKAYLANTNAVVGYLTKFNVRGTGIYQYNPVILTCQNTPSIEEFEAQTQQLHLKYRQAHRLSGPFSGGVVVQYAQPRVILNSVMFCANKSSTLMMSYLHTDIGDLRQIDIDELGIDQAYYIVGIETTHKDGVIWVKWVVKEHPTIGYGGLTPVAMEFGGTGTQDAIDWSALVRVSLATERTFAAWINLDNTDLDIKAIIAPFADTGGVMFYVSTDDILLYSNRFNSAPGAWNSNTTSMSTGTWYLVVAAYDHRLPTNDPQFWINDTSQAVSEIFTPAGTLNVELGTHVVVGNAKTVTQDYSYPFDGKIFDARIYDRILTASEVTTLYNGGTPDPSLVTDGLIFQAFAVLTTFENDYIDTALDSSDRIFENQFRAAGRVNGTPTPRTAP